MTFILVAGNVSLVAKEDSFILSILVMISCNGLELLERIVKLVEFD